MKPQNLSDGLVLRNATKKDLPAILEHFRIVHGLVIIDEMRALLEHNPRLSWEDTFIITTPESGEVVSCTILLQNAWTLDGIEVPTAEMEAVGTLESYRHRGHMRILNGEFERRVAELKPAIQVIAGIPNFYRNFGYEYAAHLGGGYFVAPDLIPRLKENEGEPVTFEQVDALSFPEFLRFREKYKPRRTWQRKIVPENAAYLLFEPTSIEQESFFFYLVKMKRKTVGVFFLAPWEGKLDILELYLDDHRHVDAVLRFATARAQEMNRLPVRVVPPNQARVREYVRALSRVQTIWRYAWYVKIPFIPRFIEVIGPLFAERLKNTEFSRFTGDLTITNYKQGYTLSFDRGAFRAVGEKSAKNLNEYHLRMPGGALTRLLMGYETYDSLAGHEPDVMCSANMIPLVRALFPQLEAIVDPFW